MISFSGAWCEADFWHKVQAGTRLATTPAGTTRLRRSTHTPPLPYSTRPPICLAGPPAACCRSFSVRQIICMVRKKLAQKKNRQQGRARDERHSYTWIDLTSSRLYALGTPVAFRAPPASLVTPRAPGMSTGSEGADETLKIDVLKRKKRFPCVKKTVFFVFAQK